MPIAQILHNTVGIERGFITTVHSYTEERIKTGSSSLSHASHGTTSFWGEYNTGGYI
ncbi:nad-dependent glyceraldehyde-3-phosphate dehydrogenase [Bartonella krasnovii]|uniref:Nad-dependent glyceraldehyde-3-phosphate dehydrogenase n=1 Tax=Bartonella krasnovii TaxID=2267275 RepID=A0A5B9D2W8_9HYPH|nr:nad-dependent glyceraldehyde-3-phosphate dehydrogenase [Bartonella krasnovii]